MTEKEYNICIGKILAGKALDVTTAHSFVGAIGAMESLLDEGDQEDYFGTEGWQHLVWE